MSFSAGQEVMFPIATRAVWGCSGVHCAWEELGHILCRGYGYIQKLQCLYLFIATYTGGPKSLFHSLFWLQHTTFSLKMLCLVHGFIVSMKKKIIRMRIREHVCTVCTRKHSWFCAWLFRQREVQTLLYFQTPIYTGPATVWGGYNSHIVGFGVSTVKWRTLNFDTDWQTLCLKHTDPFLLCF